MNKRIKLVIDNATLSEYENYYFGIHTKAKKPPIAHPWHESINTWMIMKRPAMNALKQRWKEFIIWFVERNGLNNEQIEKCQMSFFTYYPTSRRHDIDNSVPKFILDGLVEGGLIVDDDIEHITKLELQCAIDKDWPRTEITIIYKDERMNENEESCC